MTTLALFTALFLLLVVRITDGVENGLHWASKPRVQNGTAFHQADLFQTWAARILYGLILSALFGVHLGTGVLFVGIAFVDQALWQMALNYFAAGHPLKGELDTAAFLWWPDSPKRFRNERRLLQLLIGAGLVALGALW